VTSHLIGSTVQLVASPVRKKSPGRCRGLSLPEIKVKSVMGCDGSAVAAEAVIQANQTHIDVLADVFRLGEKW
jgi:hypothetical protein